MLQQKKRRGEALLLRQGQKKREARSEQILCLGFGSAMPGKQNSYDEMVNVLR